MSFNRELNFTIKPLDSGFLKEQILSNNKLHKRAIPHKQDLESELKGLVWGLFEDFLNHGNDEIKVEIKITGTKEWDK